MLSFLLTPVVPQQDTEAPGRLFSTRSPRVLLQSACRGSPDPPPPSTGGSLRHRHFGDPAWLPVVRPFQPSTGPRLEMAPAEGCGEPRGATASPPRPRSPRCRRSSFSLETPRDSRTALRARPAPCPDLPGTMTRQPRCRTVSLRCDAHAATTLPKPVPVPG